MTIPEPSSKFPVHESLDEHATDHAHQREGHGGHGWMMIACCIPMLAIAVLLVSTGVVGLSFLVVAVLCTAMMAMMMGGMHGKGSGGSG